MTHDEIIAAIVNSDAETRFMEWFRKNYPGPDTIIHRPDWHSPRIFRAANVTALDVEKIAALVEAATSANDEIGRMKPTETLVAVALPLRTALAAFKVTL